MKSLIILSGILLAVFSLTAQDSPVVVTPFEIGKGKLNFEKNPWGNELYLDFTVAAEPILNGCELTVTVWYEGKYYWKNALGRGGAICPVWYLPPQTFPSERVWWQGISLKEESAGKIKARYTCGPINQPWEYVLAGEYRVELTFIMENQPAQLRPKIEKFLQGRKTGKSWQILEFEPGKYREEDVKIKEFYRERIEEVYRLYLRLKQELKEQEARKDINKWQDYFKQFQKDLAREREKFDKYHKGVFARRYLIAKANLEEYYNLLGRYSKLQNNALFPQASEKMDSFGLERAGVIEENLKRLLKDTARDLDLKNIDIPE